VIVDLDIPTMALIVQICGVVGTLTAATIAVRSYVNSNKRAEEAKKKEQETRDRELETRQAQLLMTIYGQFSSKEWISSWYAYLLKNWSSYKEFIDLWMNDETFRNSFGVVATFFEGMGTLVREGFLDIRSVAIMMTPQIRGFWEKLGPFAEEDRVATGNRRNMENSEFLYNALMKFMKENPEYDTNRQAVPPSEHFDAKV
jgi:hypothetical protein